MRTAFKWEPVYVALFFNADPTSIFRRQGVKAPEWVWPSTRYKHLLHEARREVISPSRRSQPFSSDDLRPMLDQLRSEIEEARLPHPAARELWKICLDGLDRAEALSEK